VVGDGFAVAATLAVLVGLFRSWRSFPRGGGGGRHAPVTPA